MTAAGAFGCLETCTGDPGWWNQTDAWQWQALFALGLASALLGFTTILLVFSTGRAGLVSLGLQAVVFGVGVGLLASSDVGSAPEVVAWVFVVVSGSALAWYRRPREAV
jgi:hypothetical protein